MYCEIHILNVFLDTDKKKRKQKTDLMSARLKQSKSMPFPTVKTKVIYKKQTIHKILCAKIVPKHRKNAMLKRAE